MEQLKDRVRVDIDEDTLPPPEKKQTRSLAQQAAPSIAAGGVLLGFTMLLGALLQPAVQEVSTENQDTPILMPKDLVEQLIEATLLIIDPETGKKDPQAIVDAYYTSSYVNPEIQPTVDYIMDRLIVWVKTRTTILKVLCDPLDRWENPLYSALKLQGFDRDPKDHSAHYNEGFLYHFDAFRKASLKDSYTQDELIEIALDFIAGFLTAPHTSTFFNLSQVMRAMGKETLANRLARVYSSLGKSEANLIAEVITTRQYYQQD